MADRSADGTLASIFKKLEIENLKEREGTVGRCQCGNISETDCTSSSGPVQSLRFQNWIYRTDPEEMSLQYSEAETKFVTVLSYCNVCGASRAIGVVRLVSAENRESIQILDSSWH